jgi:hypothetical protein
MAEPLCRPCKEQQQDVVAHRIVGKTPMCDAHFRSAMGMPRLEAGPGPMKKKAEGKTMPKRIDDVTRAAILQDAAGGMSLEELRKKHHVGWGTARAIVAGAEKKIPAARHGRPPKSTNVKTGDADGLRGTLRRDVGRASIRAQEGCALELAACWYELT